MTLRIPSALLVLPLALGLGGCASAGFMVAGPLFQAAVAVADRTVERTLPADRTTAWSATVDSLERLGFRIHDVKRSEAEWSLEGTGDKVSVTVGLTSVTTRMSRLGLRVEAGGIMADKKTADEILNQVGATLTAWASAGSGSSEASADRKAATDAISSLKREVERLGTRLEQTRDTERPADVGSTPTKPAVLDNSGIFVVPTTAAVPSMPAPAAPAADPRSGGQPAVTRDPGDASGQLTSPGALDPGATDGYRGTGHLPHPPHAGWCTEPGRAAGQHSKRSVERLPTASSGTRAMSNPGKHRTAYHRRRTHAGIRRMRRSRTHAGIRMRRNHLAMALVCSFAIHAAVLLGLMRVADVPRLPGLLEVFPVTAGTGDGPLAAANDSRAGSAELLPPGPSDEPGASDESSGPGPEPLQPASLPARNGTKTASRTGPPGTRRAGELSSPRSSGKAEQGAAGHPPSRMRAGHEDVIVEPRDDAGAAPAQQIGGVTERRPESPGDVRQPGFAPAPNMASTETAVRAGLELEPADVILPVTETVVVSGQADSGPYRVAPRPITVTAGAPPASPGARPTPSPSGPVRLRPAREGAVKLSTRQASEAPPPTAPLLATAGSSSGVGYTDSTTPTGSPLGLGLARVRVQLDGPHARVTDRSSEIVSGNIVGGAPERLLLYVNDTPQEVRLDGRSFQTSVALAPGQNRLRAVVTGAGGTQANDEVSVEYVPPQVDNAIALISPRDGFAVGPNDPPMIVVEGEVKDTATTEIWVVANERRMSVTARERKFRLVIPVFEAATRVWAEAQSNGGPLRRSETVTVRVAPSRPGGGLLVMDWSPEASAAQVDVIAVWRGASGSLEPPATPVSLTPFRGSPDSPLPAAFSLGALRPGVYTFMLAIRTPAAGGSVRPTLYWPDNGTVKTRVLRPVSLAGAGRAVGARVLLPQGVLWDQEDWFTGKSESVDTITRFRFPEGTTWVERKKDLQ